MGTRFFAVPWVITLLEDNIGRNPPFTSDFNWRGSQGLVFSYNAGIRLGDVAEAFDGFYREYNGGFGTRCASHMYDSDRACLLIAISGVFTRNMVIINFSDSGKHECVVEFLVGGNKEESFENAYLQVKKFFAEWAKKILRLRSWGLAVENPQEMEAEDVSSGVGDIGAAPASEQRETTSKIPAAKAEQKASPDVVRTCIVCRLGFQEGDLLAWCPFCGAAAHRVHLLEFLHVKENCPACGHHLEERDLLEQLGRANLRLPEKNRR